ncbi:MAG: hypothetical protein PVS2B2_00530 [Candidatus Acidiferrum sp.]
MPKVMDEKQDKVTNHPQEKTELEPSRQKKSNYVPSEVRRCRSSQSEKHKECDS